MANIITIDGIPVYQALVDEQDTGMLRISLVDDPAVQSDFLAFQAAEKKVLRYSVADEEKRLVLGVVMRADFPIYRNQDGFEYYIIYKADTIRTMAEKYLAENRQNLVNLMHKDGTDVEGVEMVQFFIKGAGLNPDGFEGIADGSLFAEFHVTNDDVWAAIKDGTYKGFSLEGIFNVEPERSGDYVEQVVDALDGVFSRVIPNYKNKNMSKVKGLLARLAKALVEMGNVSTDRGVLSWDGDEDLKAGDAVYIEDENGERQPAADGDYVTGDNKTIVVVDGKVSEIKDPEAEVDPNEGEGAEKEEAAAEVKAVETDKGKLEWDNEGEDLKEGDAVYITDEEGNRTPAPDGEYKTEDGKVIVVVDGVVAEIKDAEAEVAPEKMSRVQRIAQAFSETYDEKYKKIHEAILALGFDPYGWIVEAGDDFAIFNSWDGNEEHFTRFAVSWDAEGNAIVSDPVEVKPAFVPVDEPSPEEALAAMTAERNAAAAQVAELTAQVEELRKAPAAKPAHEEYNNVTGTTKTGNKKLDNLARIMGAGE